MIIWYGEERKAKVNELAKTQTIEEIENMTLWGDYSGFIIGDGQLVGCEHYEVEA